MHEVLDRASDRDAALARFVGTVSDGEAATLRRLLDEPAVAADDARHLAVLLGAGRRRTRLARAGRALARRLALARARDAPSRSGRPSPSAAASR